MLKNMVAVVTGAANGLGRQTLTHFFQEKAQVFGCDIRSDDGHYEQTYNGDVGFMKADVRSENDMEELFKKTIDKFGRVDILVNCAGFAAAHTTSTTKGEPFRLEAYQRMVEVNICGQFNASRLAAQAMAKNKPAGNGSRGIIILTSGFASRTSRRGQAAIGSCNGGVESMTLPMSRDLGPLGIRVVTISPGFFETPLTSSFTEEVTEYFSRAQAFPHRFGDPKEYSDLALHIVQNSMINGEVISIDGGLIVPPF